MLDSAMFSKESKVNININIRDKQDQFWSLQTENLDAFFWPSLKVEKQDLFCHCLNVETFMKCVKIIMDKTTTI